MKSFARARLKCYSGVVLLWMISNSILAHICQDDWDHHIRANGYIAVDNGVEVNRGEGIREVGEELCNAQGYFNTDLKCPSLIWHPGSEPVFWQCKTTMVDWDEENETISSLE